MGDMRKDCLGICTRRMFVLRVHPFEPILIIKSMQNGTPFSKFFPYIDPGREFPVRTTVAAIVFVCLYGLL
jgi:hypothetical protein